MNINLLPVNERPLPSTTIRPEFLLILSGVLLLLFSGGYSLYLSSVQNDLQIQLASKVQHRQILQAQSVQIGELEKRLAKMETRQTQWADLQARAQAGIAPSHLALLTGAIPPGLWVEEVVFGPREALIKGYTQTPTSLMDLIQNLESQGQRVAVEVDQVIPILGRVFEIRVGKGAGS